MFDKEFHKQQKTSYPKAGTPWSPVDSKTLESMVKERKSLLEMTIELERPVAAIVKRIELLQLKAGDLLQVVDTDPLRYVKSSDQQASLEPDPAPKPLHDPLFSEPRSAHESVTAPDPA